MNKQNTTMAKLKENNDDILRTVVNREFRIKVYSTHDKGKTVNSLRGYSGLVALFGITLTRRMVANAIVSPFDKLEHRLRRGIKVTFYSK